MNDTNMIGRKEKKENGGLGVQMKKGKAKSRRMRRSRVTDTD